MLHIKLKKTAFSLFIGLFITLCSTTITYAEETYGTGDIASSRAAEQRAAIAKRKERLKKEKEAEAKKATENQQEKPTETQKPAEPSSNL